MPGDVATDSDTMGPSRAYTLSRSRGSFSCRRGQGGVGGSEAWVAWTPFMHAYMLLLKSRIVSYTCMYVCCVQAEAEGVGCDDVP